MACAILALPTGKVLGEMAFVKGWSEDFWDYLLDKQSASWHL